MDTSPEANDVADAGERDEGALHRMNRRDQAYVGMWVWLFLIVMFLAAAHVAVVYIVAAAIPPIVALVILTPTAERPAAPRLRVRR